MKDVHRKLTEEETRAIVRKVDEALGFCSPTGPYPSEPTSEAEANDGSSSMDFWTRLRASRAGSRHSEVDLGRKMSISYLYETR